MVGMNRRRSKSVPNQRTVAHHPFAEMGVMVKWDTYGWRMYLRIGTVRSCCAQIQFPLNDGVSP